jgi:hypothetical protein
LRREDYLFKKEPILGFICRENILIIRPANKSKKKDFQKKSDEHDSNNMEGTSIIESKKTIIPFMAESEKKEEEGPSMLQTEGGEKRLPSGKLCLTNGLDSGACEGPRMSKRR